MSFPSKTYCTTIKFNENFNETTTKKYYSTQKPVISLIGDNWGMISIDMGDTTLTVKSGSIDRIETVDTRSGGYDDGPF